MSRILIIEDEEAIADLEKDYLELSGFEVEICNRGDTGLTRALNEEFDLIILPDPARQPDNLLYTKPVPEFFFNLLPVKFRIPSLT